MFSRTFTAINLLVSITRTTTTAAAAAAAAAAASSTSSRGARIKGAILGSLIGDSLALGGHYEYDAKVIADRIGSYRELSSYS